MPSSTMIHEDEYPVPAGVPCPATLQKVEVRTINFKKKDQYGNRTNEDDSFDKWVWEFKISGGDHEGIKVYGETQDKLTNREDNLVRQWAETLLNTTIEVGQGLNTDSLLGLPCVITVRHDEPREKKDGGKFYPCPVDEVFPAASGGGDFAGF
jgi:hypothetical protein